MKLIELWIKRIEKWSEIAAVVLVIAIMLIVFIDVVLRYLFNSPLGWAHDIISLYLMAGLFFLALSYTYASNAHVGVDILVQKLSEKGRRVAECLTCLVSIPLFLLIASEGGNRAWTNWINNDVISGLIAWPTWIGAAVMTFGAALLALRLLFRLAGNIASLATGRDIVAPMATGKHIGGE